MQDHGKKRTFRNPCAPDGDYNLGWCGRPLTSLGAEDFKLSGALTPSHFRTPRQASDIVDGPNEGVGFRRNGVLPEQAARERMSILVLIAKYWLLARGAVLWCLRSMVAVLQRLSFGNKSFAVRNAVSEATNWKEWLSVARARDKEHGYVEWAADKSQSRQVLDVEGIQTFLDEISAIRASAGEDSEGTMKELAHLRKHINRNTFGITHPSLYNSYASGTKRIVGEYIDTCVSIVNQSISTFGQGSECNLQTRRLDILRTLVHSNKLYGSTALLLDGSIALGAYHLGIVKGLVETGCLPRVISGSNTGAIVAAYLCCSGEFNPSALDFSVFSAKAKLPGSSFRRRLRRLWEEGTVMDVNILLEFAKTNVGEMTFLEAYQKTGFILNIQVLHDEGEGDPPSAWLLNYLSAPNVLVYTAAVRSCSTRFFYKPVELLCKSLNGEVMHFDIPAYFFSNARNQSHVPGYTPVHAAIERMRQLFNIKLFIISECSATRLPFMRLGHRNGLVSQYFHFITEELWRAAAMLSRQKLFKGRLTNTLQAMRGSYPEPHILLQPVTTLSDVLMLARSPDAEWLAECERRSAAQLWPRLVEISSHVRLEGALHRALAECIRRDPSLKEAQATFNNLWETH